MHTKSLRTGYTIIPLGRCRGHRWLISCHHDAVIGNLAARSQTCAARVGSSPDRELLARSIRPRDPRARGWERNAGGPRARLRSVWQLHAATRAISRPLVLGVRAGSAGVRAKSTPAHLARHWGP